MAYNNLYITGSFFIPYSTGRCEPSPTVATLCSEIFAREKNGHLILQKGMLITTHSAAQSPNASPPKKYSLTYRDYI